MPLETVGSAEALLQLFAKYQGSNGRRPHARSVWKEIVGYLENGGRHHLYDLSDSGPSGPADQFLADLDELLSSGFIAPLGKGRFEVTPLGRCLAFTRTLPGSLADLEERVLQIEESAPSSNG